MSYTPQFEDLLKHESEQMECLSILHTLENIANKNKTNLYNIPVIILSSIIGITTASSLINITSYFNFIIGGLSILTAILKTIDTYFQFASLSERHRIISILYYKLSKLIQVQLALEQDIRIPAMELLKLIENSQNNIKESEPNISNEIIKKFNLKYPITKYKTSRPAICNGLTDIKINKGLMCEFRISSPDLNGPLSYSSS